MTNKKIFIIIIVFLLLSLNLFSSIQSKSSSKSYLNLEFKLKEKSIMITASSSYEYGLKIGEKYRIKYKLLDFFTSFSRNNNIDKNFIKAQLNSLENYCPEYIEELEGLSASTNIRLERLFEIQILLSKIFGGHCTVTLSTGPATKNNQTFVSQNWDASARGLYKYLIRLCTFTPHIRRIGTNYRYVYIGIPILEEIFLMNEKGLCWCGTETSLTKNESRYIDEGEGIPIYFLERKTMETCKNISEVAELWKTSNRSADKNKEFPNKYDFGTAGWADREGGILYIEQSHNHILCVYGNSTDITNTSEGILWHSLHHIWIDPNLTGSKTPEEHPLSVLKTDRAKELLEEYYGNITVDVLKSICRDHGGGFDPNKPDPADICWHPTKDHPYVTTISWIAQPKELTLYWTHRQPCKSFYWKHDFSRIFRN